MDYGDNPNNILNSSDNSGDEAPLPEIEMGNLTQQIDQHNILNEMFNTNLTAVSTRLALIEKESYMTPEHPEYLKLKSFANDLNDKCIAHSKALKAHTDTFVIILNKMAATISQLTATMSQLEDKLQSQENVIKDLIKRGVNEDISKIKSNVSMSNPNKNLIQPDIKALLEKIKTAKQQGLQKPNGNETNTKKLTKTNKEVKTIKSDKKSTPKSGKTLTPFQKAKAIANSTK